MADEDTQTLNEKLEDVISTMDEIKEVLVSISVSLEKIANK
ncbi:MAG: hypothetical protein Q7S27_02265 [Nanoarchaeota archaeon]|nr:hypothetical protein [Nanoarchaeota archaeon]